VPSLRHSAKARDDLLDIWLTVAGSNQAAADRLFDRLETRIQILAQWPEIGTPVPAIASDARMLVERPYLIFYRVIPDGVQIVRILHGARDIDSVAFLQGN
jgi:toxin ParE1/3/4